MTLTVEEWREVYRSLDDGFRTEKAAIEDACHGQDGEVRVNLPTPLWMFVIHELSGALRERMRGQLVFYEEYG